MTDTQQQRNWQSVRTVLEGLILAVLVWTGSSLVGVKSQLAVLQVQVATIQTQLADLPAMRSRVDTLEVRVARNEQDLGRAK